MTTCKKIKENPIEKCKYCNRPFTTLFDCGIHEKACKIKNIKNVNRR